MDTVIEADFLDVKAEDKAIYSHIRAKDKFLSEHPNVKPGALYSTKTLALLMDCSEKTLATYRLNGEGPKFIKIGRKIFYPVIEYERYICSNVRQNTAYGKTGNLRVLEV